jgi:UDP-N-acetylmuramoylalanine--D-glutamate ligase
MIDLRGKQALVMGLGVHGGGLGVARFLVGQGAAVTVTDLRGPELLQPSLDALAGLPIRYVLGEHRDEDFRAADLVIRNPGVPRESRYLQIARAAGAAIEMEMTLFFRLCPGPILGITGTKGKTTTTLLTGAMLRAQYPHTVVAGNLRVSALEALPRITAGTPVVLELSSWQLEGLGEAQLSPQYACITNISPDHLDRYGSMDAYIQAKRQIYWWQKPEDVMVMNFDDPFSKGHSAYWDTLDQRRGGRVVYFTSERLSGFSQWPFDDTGALVIQHGNQIFWNDFAGEFGRATPRMDKPNTVAHLGRPILDLEDIQLPGKHNVSNVMAAAALAKSFGVTDRNIRRAVRNFTAVEHRLEFVRELKGVRYINDTAATAPEATIAALRSFDAPIVLIAGGADKNLPFDDLARTILDRAKAVVLLKGTATPKLEQALAQADERRKTKDER